MTAFTAKFFAVANTLKGKLFCLFNPKCSSKSPISIYIIADKMFETMFRFDAKQCTMGKVQYLAFSNFSLVLAKISFWEGHWETGDNFMQF